MKFGTKLWVNEVHSKVVALDFYVGRRKIYAVLFWGALETRFEPKDPCANQINRLQVLTWSECGGVPPV